MDSENKATCSRDFVFYVINIISLLLVLLCQGSVLNYFIISYYRDSATPYFWFLADFLIVSGFMASLVIAHKYLLQKKNESQAKFKFSPENLIGLNATSIVGALPSGYLMWLIYSSILTAKVCVLFKTDIPATIDLQWIFGPQLLKLSIAASAFVFILFVEGHHDYSPGSYRKLYINHLMSGTSIELLDSVTFLGLLLVDESKILFTFTLENIILSLSTINILLPTIPLYRLSLSDFSTEEKFVGITFVYKLFHLLFINTPFLIIRIYIWNVYGGDVSMFILKNAMGIMFSLKEISAYGKEFWAQIHKTNKKKRPLELKSLNFKNNINKVKGKSSNEFEEVDLNDDKGV